MPFTLAHPAAAIPFAKPLGRYGVLSALVIGSFLPDLPHFIPVGVNRVESHSFYGLFWFCLPIGMVIFWLYHFFMKRALLSLAPRGVRRRIAPENLEFPRARLIGVLLSLLIGSATHDIWDSFTHVTGYAVQHIAWLDSTLTEIGGHKLHVYHVLQYVSSVLGLALIALWLLHWYQRSPKYPVESTKAPLLVASLGYLLIGIIPCAAAIYHGFVVLDWEAWLRGARISAVPTVSLGCQVALAGILIYSLFYRFFVDRAFDTFGAEND